MKKDYSRKVAALCPTCASDMFDFDESLPEEQRNYTCTTCEAVFTFEALMEANSDRIDSTVEEIKEDVVKDIQEDLSRALSGAFRRR